MSCLWQASMSWLVHAHQSRLRWRQRREVAAAFREVNPQPQDRAWSGRRCGGSRCSPEERPRLTLPAAGNSTSPCAEIAAGRPLRKLPASLIAELRAQIRPHRPGPRWRTWTQLPFVTDVYKRDLTHRELLHRLPAASLRLALYRPRLPLEVHLLPVAADRGRAPLPVAQRRQRDRAEMALANKYFPQVKEFFFDDDTFTDDLPRAEEIARGSESWASPGHATPKLTCRAGR